VKEFNMTLYEDLYPQWYKFKYPKAGEENAKVDIFVYDIDKNSITLMETGDNKERYIPRIKWLPNSQELCVTELNRLQNEAKLRIADVSSGQSFVFYTEKDDKYISEFTDDFVTFFDSGNKALILSEKDGYMHIYLYKLDGTLLNQVTKGLWEVDEFYGLDESNGILYYSSTEISPLERHIYSIRLDGSEKTKIPSSKKGMNSVRFNSEYSNYILIHSDANTPYTYEIYNKEHKLVRTLEDNRLLKELMLSNGFEKKEFFSFKPEHGIELNAYKILPPNFKKNKKYPVLIYTYGGPESQLVLDEWHSRMPWFQYLAQHGYIVVCLDNRGTDGRGEAFKKSTYMKLGNLESEDQIALAEYLAQQSFVDKDRIGVFGWSYCGVVGFKSEESSLFI
jgi:dipeptidyl-peptidase-4